MSFKSKAEVSTTTPAPTLSDFIPADAGHPAQDLVRQLSDVLKSHSDTHVAHKDGKLQLMKRKDPPAGKPKTQWERLRHAAENEEDPKLKERMLKQADRLEEQADLHGDDSEKE